MVIGNVFKQMFFPRQVWGNISLENDDILSYALMAFLHFMLIFLFRFLSGFAWGHQIILCMYDSLLYTLMMLGLWVWMSLLLSVLSSVWGSRLGFFVSWSSLLMCMLPLSVFGFLGVVFPVIWRGVFLGLQFLWIGVIFWHCLQLCKFSSMLKRFFTAVVIFIPWSIMGIIFSQWIGFRVLS